VGAASRPPVDRRLGGGRSWPGRGVVLVLATVALIAGLAGRGRARRTDQLRAGLVMWGLWLITFGIIYSEMGNIPHTAYMASLAPPLAALSGTGIVLFWRWYRSGSRVWWLLPLAVAVQVAWAYQLWSGYRSFLPWLAPAAIAAGGIAIVGMALGRLSRRTRLKAGVVAGTAGVAAMLAAPVAWSASVLDAKYAGSSFDASAGPAGGFGPGGGGARRGGGFGAEAGGFRPGRFREERRSGDFPGGGNAPGGAGGGLFDTATTLSSGQERLYRYLTAHRGGARYLFAVQGWTDAGPYILATGQAVLPMGGFSGSVPEPTLARVRQLVATGQLRYFMLGGAGGIGGGGFGGRSGNGTSETARIAAWVQSACKTVQVAGAGSTGTLYQCGTG